MVVANNYEKLTHYINGAVDGEQSAFVFDFLQGVQYPKGKRDIIVFLCLKSDMKTPQMDVDCNFRFCGIVCNHCEGKSGKAKVNKVKRYLLTEKDGLSLKESFRNLPPMDYFLREVPYQIFVQNKTVGKNTVANIVRIKSQLYGKWMYIKQKFDGDKASINSGLPT